MHLRLLPVIISAWKEGEGDINDHLVSLFSSLSQQITMTQLDMKSRKHTKTFFFQRRRKKDFRVCILYCSSTIRTQRSSNVSLVCL